MNKKEVRRAVKIILKAIGEDPLRHGLRDTPKRIADMYEEIFAGIKKDPVKELKIYRAKNEDEMIIVKDIPFYSVCEHHLLPFLGKAHIVYIPKDNRITGFSSLVKVIDIMEQERGRTRPLGPSTYSRPGCGRSLQGGPAIPTGPRMLPTP